MIFHLSAPDPQHSLNGHTPDYLCTVKYQDLQDAVRLMQEIGPEARVGKSDMEHAFRQVPIHPKDWPLLVFKATDPISGKEKFFVDKALPFGSSVSCQIYQRVSNALSWILTQKSGRPNVNYLDDFLFVHRGVKRTNWQIDQFLAISQEIGFLVSEEKN